MNVSDHEHQENLKLAKKLQTKGFHFEVTPDKYKVTFRDQHVSTASVNLPRTKPLTYAQRLDNIRDFLASAIREAQRHEQKMKAA